MKKYEPELGQFSFDQPSYSWNEEEEQDFNFKWRDFKVSWYKYFGRGMTMNREISNEELREMLLEFIEEVK